jgi:hypothetical protein
MADIRIKDLPTNTPTLSSDYFLFEKQTAPNTFVTSTNVLSSVPFAYRSGDTIVEAITLGLVAATLETVNSTNTYSERAAFILDLGNTTKWAKRGCSGPEINFYVIGRSTNADTTAEFQLFRKDTSSALTESIIFINSTTTFQILSATVSQNAFPSTPTAVTMRMRRGATGTGGAGFITAMIELKWTVL